MALPNSRGWVSYLTPVVENAPAAEPEPVAPKVSKLNVKGNRHGVVATFATSSYTTYVYPIPEGVDLENKDQVEKWYVEDRHLYIHYTVAEIEDKRRKIFTHRFIRTPNIIGTHLVMNKKVDRVERIDPIDYTSAEAEEDSHPCEGPDILTCDEIDAVDDDMYPWDDMENPQDHPSFAGGVVIYEEPYPPPSSASPPPPP